MVSLNNNRDGWSKRLTTHRRGHLIYLIIEFIPPQGMSPFDEPLHGMLASSHPLHLLERSVCIIVPQISFSQFFLPVGYSLWIREQLHIWPFLLPSKMNTVNISPNLNLSGLSLKEVVMMQLSTSEKYLIMCRTMSKPCSNPFFLSRLIIDHITWCINFILGSRCLVMWIETIVTLLSTIVTFLM